MDQSQDVPDPLTINVEVWAGEDTSFDSLIEQQWKDIPGKCMQFYNLISYIIGSSKPSFKHVCIYTQTVG